MNKYIKLAFILSIFFYTAAHLELKAKHSPPPETTEIKKCSCAWWCLLCCRSTKDLPRTPSYALLDDSSDDEESSCLICNSCCEAFWKCWYGFCGCKPSSN